MGKSCVIYREDAGEEEREVVGKGWGSGKKKRWEVIGKVRRKGGGNAVTNVGKMW